MSVLPSATSLISKGRRFCWIMCRTTASKSHLYETVSTDKKAFAKAAAIIYACNDPFVEVPYYQRCNHRVFVQNAPQMPLTEMEMDDVYDRGYTGRQWSPGPEVTSLGEVWFSVTANWGCFGSCAFCAIGMHQGRIVQRRSADSILKEARMMTKLPAFKGYIHDVGGPTANFYGPSCEKQRQFGACRHCECLYPEVCPNINADERGILPSFKANARNSRG